MANNRMIQVLVTVLIVGTFSGACAKKPRLTKSKQSYSKRTIKSKRYKGIPRPRQQKKKKRKPSYEEVLAEWYKSVLNQEVRKAK